jgi:hypothetical protein
MLPKLFKPQQFHAYLLSGESRFELNVKAKRATTHREDQEMLRSYQQLGQPLGQSMYGSKGTLAKLNYMDIKLLLDRQIVKNKKGQLIRKGHSDFGQGLA